MEETGGTGLVIVSEPIVPIGMSVMANSFHVGGRKGRGDGYHNVPQVEYSQDHSRLLDFRIGIPACSHS